MRGGKFAIIIPERIAPDIGDNDGLPPMGGRAAGAGLGADAHAVDSLYEGVREARRGAVPQLDPVILEQQDGAEYPRQLRLDEAHEMLEHLLQRCAHRDHLEDFAPAHRATSPPSCAR